MYPLTQESSPPIPESEIPDGAFPRDSELREEALPQVDAGCLDGPYGLSQEDAIRIRGRPLRRNPAFRLGLSQGENLGAAGDMRQR